jgi:hypothetical protein
MKEVDRSHAFDGISKAAGWGIAVGATAVFIAASLFGRVREGTLDFAFVAIATVTTSCWYFRDLRHRLWFWLIMAAVVAIHAIAIALLALPPLLGHGSGRGAFVPVWLFDSFFVFCCVRLAERVSLGWPKTIEVACRVCGKDVDKKSVQCPYCGTWHPAPESPWLILIGLAPVFILMVAAWVWLGVKH